MKKHDNQERYICKKTGREFNTKQGFTNHIRLQYNTIEEAYLLENDITPDKCIICNKNAKFCSFWLGYKQTCCSDECIREYMLINNRQIGKNSKEKEVQGLRTYVFENLSWYLKHKKCTNIIEPFTGKNIKNINILTFLSRNIKNFRDDKRLYYKGNCLWCNREIIINKFKPNKLCSSKSCITNRTINKLYFDEDTIYKYFNKNKIVYNTFIKNKICLDTMNKIKFIYDILLQEAKDINEYIRLHELFFIIQGKTKYTYDGFINLIRCDQPLGDFIRKMREVNPILFNKFYSYQCKYCHKDINLSRTKQHQFCSKECYFKGIKDSELYDRPYKEETKKKQSIMMLKKIENGEVLSFGVKLVQRDRNAVITPCLLYYIKGINPNDNNEFYKIGITTLMNIKYRFSKKAIARMKFIEIELLETSLLNASAIEEHILWKYKDKRISIRTKEFKSTECFSADILENIPVQPNKTKLSFIEEQIKKENK